MTEVEFPAMRREVAGALASLADPDYQQRAWIEGRFESPHAYEDLTMIINILYDDTQVLPDPRTRLGTVLLAGSEIDALEALAEPLSNVLDRLGNAEPSAYMQSPEWPEVVRRSAVALAAMVRGGGCI